MNKIRNFLLSIALTTSLAAIAPMSHAAHEGHTYDSYGEAVGNKAGRAFGNLIGAPLEIPKNMINTVNDSNLVYGVIGGLAKGILHTLGRLGAGITDLITFPLPTQPIASPAFIGNDFDVDTTYGPYFRLQDYGTAYVAAPKKDDYPMATNTDQSDALAEANRRALAAEQAAERAARSAAETNRKLDNMFQKSMMK